MCDNRREGNTPRNICTYQQKVEIVSSFEYLGTAINRTLAFNENTGHVCTVTIISSEEVEKFQRDFILDAAGRPINGKGLFFYQSEAPDS